MKNIFPKMCQDDLNYKMQKCVETDSFLRKKIQISIANKKAGDRSPAHHLNLLPIGGNYEVY